MDYDTLDRVARKTYRWFWITLIGHFALIAAGQVIENYVTNAFVLSTVPLIEDFEIALFIVAITMLTAGQVIKWLKEEL